MEEYIKKIIGKNLLVESVNYIVKENLKNSIKEHYKENIEQYYINCLVVGDTDILLNELTEKELRLLNELQKLNIQLMKKRQFSNMERKNILLAHATNFKLINS
jgi:predicted glycosyltransferase